MTESGSFPPLEMPRRAFLFAGSIAMAAGYVTLSATPAHPAPTSPAAAVDEAPPTLPRTTLIGLL